MQIRRDSPELTYLATRVYQVAEELGWPEVTDDGGDPMLPPTELSWWVACVRREKHELDALVVALRRLKASLA